jgi:NTE family protein
MKLETPSNRIGLAFSGGGIRGIAHIGVLKALAEFGLTPSIVAGTSIGSIIGAGIAAGMDWQELAAMASRVFWPSLLHGRSLERFCTRCFPESFADLKIPFVATATAVPSRRTVILNAGKLAPAISASCALHGRHPVVLAGERLKDGGFSCVLPSQVCRDLGADRVIASDVWEFSALLRGAGIGPAHRRAGTLYPTHYMRAVACTDVLIQPRIPLSSYVLAPGFVDRLIASGETAARRALQRDEVEAPSSRVFLDSHP